ncbi:MAG TPA: hypothetical protein PLK94_00790 [Alphaproteobacteria bacterium]|nr:hypothetical protein [Alphaproteobacteria bacterium]HOO49802.1 hypothetical protein [Alphaproteobacteria bacterium]
MGKERDKLLWSLGQKPSDEDDPTLAERLLEEEVREGRVPEPMKRGLDKPKSPKKKKDAE